MELQTRLFAVAEPRVDEAAVVRARRIPLAGTAFLDHAPRAVLGDDVLFDRLVDRMAWAETRRPMYDRVVDVPRLLASVPDDGPGDPILDRLSALLSEKYGRPVDRITLAPYRDGRDSVAMHGDRMGDQVDDCVVAILSLRGPRRFVLRPSSACGRAARAGGAAVVRPRAGGPAGDGRVVPARLRPRRAEGRVRRAADVGDVPDPGLSVRVEPASRR
jgi:alkylated DNA repair dioxygenase AlkB